MDWRLAGQPQTVVMQFMVDGQPVIPDADSITFTAWDNAGEIIRQVPWVQPVEAVPTQIEVVLETDLGNIPADAQFESRYVRADFKWESKPYFVKTNYRLYRMVPMTVEPQTVRSIIGADYEELPDYSIDLVEAYFYLSMAFNTGVLRAALARADKIALVANDAIALQAAVTVLPSLQSRLLKADKIDNAGFTRFTVDFEKLEADLKRKLLEAINAIVLDATGTLPATPTVTLFYVNSQTDRLTGTDPV